MAENEKHKKFVKEAGRFIIRCQLHSFNENDVDILEKWGNWFQALIDGTLIPFTMKQEQFIRVAKGELEPETIYETIWCKYLKNMTAESKPGDPKDKEYLPPEDTFYSREMYDQNRKMMYGVMNQNHRS